MDSSNKTRHPDLVEWVDFVRGVASPVERGRMQAHLDGGCATCREMASLLSQIAKRAREEAQHEMPDFVMRNARAVYSLQRPEEVRLLPRTIARLVFDSFREPAAVGVRGERSLAHQLMYVAGPYYVDLRLEKEPGSTQIRMIGQIATREQGATGVPDVPVFLLSRNVIVNKTATNKFGEFAMEYAPKHGLRLFAPIAGENHIEIRLGRVASIRSTA